MIIDNKSYTGDGSTRQYATSAIILSNSHIAVFLDNVLQPTNSYDLLGSVVLFKTAPSNGVAINFVVSDTGEDLPVAPNEYNTVYANITEIQNVSSIINQIVNLDDIKNEIVNVNDLSTEIVNLYNNRLAILGLYAINTDIASLNSIKAKFESIYADKTKLDSLYADKSTLDGLYSSKIAIDELYLIKGKLDSLYADKSTIDGLYSSKNAIDSLYVDKLVLDTLYAMKTKLDSVYADKVKLDSIYTDKTQLDAIYANLNRLIDIYNNIDDLLSLSATDPSYDSVTFNGGLLGEGTLSWNDTDKTLDLTCDEDVTLQLGQELFVRGKNTTGTTITNGTVLMVTGAVGNSGVITFGRHTGLKADGHKIAGIATEDILNNDIGFSLLRGKLRGINCTGIPYGETWNEGDILYVGINGLLTNIEPIAGNLNMMVGIVINNTINGTIQVRTTGIDEDISSNEIFYDNVTSGLTATTVKDGIDELASSKVRNINIGSNTISSVLATIGGSIGESIIVSDKDVGGVFNYSATGTHNNGTVFSGLSCYWVRQYSGAVNVKWFGARGDGLTDDTEAIKKALVFKNVYFDNGTYIINNTVPILIQDSIKITAGKAVYIHPSVQDVTLFSVVGIDVIIEDISIIGDGTFNSIGSNTGRSVAHIEIYSGTAPLKNQNVVIRNVKLINPANTGIQLYRAVGATIDNCTLESTYSGAFFQGHFGISVYSSANITITNTKINGFVECIVGGGTSSYVFDDFSGNLPSPFTRNTIVDSCILQNPADHCYYYSSNTTNNIVSNTNMVCKRAGSGSALKYSGQTTITGNTIVSIEGGISGRMGYKTIIDSNYISYSAISDGTDSNSAIIIEAYDKEAYALDGIRITNNIIDCTGESVFGIYIYSLARESDGKQNIISNVNISNNTFNNIGGSAAAPYTSVIVIYQDKDYILGNTLFAKNIKISDNIINANDNCKFGIFAGGLPTHAGIDGLCITNNIFRNIKTTNILFTGKNSVIKGNTFLPQPYATAIQEITNPETPSSNNYFGEIIGSVNGAEFLISQETTMYTGREVKYIPSMSYNFNLEGYRPFKKIICNPDVERKILLDYNFPVNYTVAVSNISLSNNLLFELKAGGTTSTILPNTSATFMCIGSNTFIRI